MKSVARTTLLLVLAMAAGIAQTHKPRKPAPTDTPPHEEGAPWPLEHLAVEGNQNYTTEQVLAVGKLKVGQTVDKNEFEATRQRLLDTGVFDRAGYRYAAAQDGKG
jgi:outer membrane protein assembly factor BamA